MSRKDCVALFLKRSRLFELACFACACLFLAGCSQQPPLEPRRAQTIAPTQAFIFPPPGGPGIVGVIETTFANAYRQEIALATEARTPGENKITVTMFKAKGGDGNFGTLPDTPLVEIDLMNEARAAWPQANMKPSPFYVQNDYGPFGYAVGRAPTGDTCVYAWQRIDPSRKPSGGIDRGAIAVRLQLCDKSRSEESLLGVMYQLRINGGVFEPWRAPAQIGRIFVPIKPYGVEGFATVAQPSQANAKKPAQPTGTKAVVPTPPPGAPIVPAPGAVNSGPIVPAPPGSSGSKVIVPPPPVAAN